MKKIKAIVKDKNTLILDEDALKGDYIDLSSLVNVDNTSIEEAINNETDKVYIKKLNELKEQLVKDRDLEIKNLRLELENAYQFELTKLNEKLSNYELNKKLEINSINNENERNIQNLKNEIEKLNNQINLNQDIEKQKINNALLNKELEYKELLINIEKDFENKIREKEEIINNLRRQKASLNVKQTGEDLEAWCNNEVFSYMQNGLFNCTWTKDNIVVKEEGEQKGSKADYIFKIYASNNHLENELLSSVCLEMKDENPDSVNKKTNADYYKQLDKNRNKKNCKYALLVSNLENDKPNDLPLYRVNEYEDMYVVRPAYMMTFLNILTSLTNKFKELITTDKNEKIELKNAKELMNEFSKLKNTYLDKPLEGLQKNIDSLRKNNESIIKASKNIEEAIENITRNYLKVIQDKLESFDIKINRSYKRNEKEKVIS